ncbi:D-lyxose/D-mannose family sugar isomerase [bacterium]|nr:D-lyxose/D-mannose family sugar isomerase [bacterium]
MKRSKINTLMQQSASFFDTHHFKLPPWAFWSPKGWQAAGPEADEIRKNQLGWDITDFGLDDFINHGLILFTVRNGNFNDPKNKKTYAEKIMIAQENQKTPMHFHRYKMEDIINRGGGKLCIQLYNSNADEELAETPVILSVDGIQREFPAGRLLTLEPGESVTLPQFVYHSFWAEAGAGSVLIGEVSMVNDDENDNRFLDPVGRFPTIEEDIEPVYLLCTEYPAAQ